MHCGLRFGWLRSVFSLLLGLVLAAGEAPSAGRLQSYKVQGGTLILQYEGACAELETLNGGVVHWACALGEVLPRRHSYAVVSSAKDPLPPVQEAEDVLRIALPQGEVRVARRGMRIEVFQSGQRVFAGEAELDPSRKTITVRMEEAGERFYGLGCKTGPMELTGRSFVNYNTDAYGYGAGTDPIYTTIPFYLAVRPGASCGVFVDS